MTACKYNLNMPVTLLRDNLIQSGAQHFLSDGLVSEVHIFLYFMLESFSPE